MEVFWRLAVALPNGSNRPKVDHLQVLLGLALGDLDLHDLQRRKAFAGVLGWLIPRLKTLKPIDKIGDRVAGESYAVDVDARHKSLLEKVFDLVVGQADFVSHFIVSGLCLVGRLICFRRVNLIGPGNKGQHLYPKRYRSFSQNMRFANENTGEKDCGFFG